MADIRGILETEEPPILRCECGALRYDLETHRNLEHPERRLTERELIAECRRRGLLRDEGGR